MSTGMPMRLWLVVGVTPSLWSGRSIREHRAIQLKLTSFWSVMRLGNSILWFLCHMAVWSSEHSIIESFEFQYLLGTLNLNAWSSNCFFWLFVFSCRPFWISWAGGLLQVGRGNTVSGSMQFLKYQMTETQPISAMAVSTGWGTTGQWVITNPHGTQLFSWPISRQLLEHYNHLNLTCFMFRHKEGRMDTQI